MELQPVRANSLLLVLGISLIRIAAALLLLLYLEDSAIAQHAWWHFEPHSYYDPLSAEPRSAETKILFLGRGSSVPFAVNPGQSYIWDISMGSEIPLVGWTQGDLSTRNSPVAAHSFGVGVWLPVSFHLLEDISKDPSAPVLDTDYRFGLMLKAQYGLGKNKAGTRDSYVGIRYVPIAHESTHIGDEYTLGATQKYGNQFERVNVSYQYWELGGSYENNFHPVIQTKALNVILRGGIIHEAFNGGRGWYDAGLLQPVGGTVTPSERNIEPYLGAEAFFSANKYGGPFISIDDRDRTIYTYHRASASVPEPTEWSVNTMLGWRENPSDRRFQPSYYVRYYHGVNPAGQFRDQPNYQLFGLGLLVHF